MDQKITVDSPFNHSRSADDYGHDTFWQVELLRNAITQLLQDPFEHGRDLSGRTVCLTLHEDGLCVTAELLDPKDDS